ncbi:hypothetical protein F5148DRAFT_1145629 [Russula earlei]|uniref:Uncharacterized protein n=1 Tax=Russula earlei TaxID=71964 RepID=A0ACC0UN67_9AGAM|nr:hypothetical protein F5148DRAFT_1145629 [Russula earlei]
MSMRDQITALIIMIWRALRSLPTATPRGCKNPSRAVVSVRPFLPSSVTISHGASRSDHQVAVVPGIFARFPLRFVSSGRGGAGNIHPRRVIENYPGMTSFLMESDQAEHDYMLAHEASMTTLPRTVGRGGVGNVSIPHSPSGTVLVSVSVTTF